MEPQPPAAAATADEFSFAAKHSNESNPDDGQYQPINMRVRSVAGVVPEHRDTEKFELGRSLHGSGHAEGVLREGCGNGRGGRGARMHARWHSSSGSWGHALIRST